MDNSASQQQQDGGVQSSPNDSTNTPQAQQEEPHPVVINPEDSSEWETEPSDTGGEGDMDEDEDDDFMDDDGFFPDDPDRNIDIEALTPSVRANRRPNIDDDTWSEFSGDEKYEPKASYDSEPGGGDRDMVDANPEEMPIFSERGERNLTHSIRQLMLNLTKGRKDRERKLRIEAWREGAFAATSSSLASATSPSSSSSTSPASGAYLYRLMVRGTAYPQEVEHSPAVTFHRQCANSLTVTPSPMGVMDDIFTLNVDSIMRCGVLDKMTITTYRKRMMASMGNDPTYDDIAARRIFQHDIEGLKTVKATKFLRNSLYQFNQLPPSEHYVPIDENENPICMAHKYGYLAMGSHDGTLVVYCTDIEGEPYEIHNDKLTESLRFVMLSSIQIVRWPRYYRSRTMTDESDLGATDWNNSTEELDQDGEEYDEKDGYPTKPGQFDHYLIMTGNNSGLFIASLPDHPERKDQRLPRNYDYYSEDMHEHRYKFKDDRTWIRTGFHEDALNDARVSPNGRWIAVVGDASKIWTLEVTHVPETEKQREQREQEIMMEDLETDSEYATDESTSEIEEKNDSTDALGAARGEKRSRSADDDLSDSEDSSSWTPKLRGARIPRLLHQFGTPVEMHIPEKALKISQTRRGTRRWDLQERYSSQYVTWNATSTKLAHSSDVSSCVLVWSMPSREIVCSVDTGGPSYGIDFHPRLENLFAVANWYGFVHVVDVTGCCVGDEDLVPDEEHYNGKITQGPGLNGCEGPHYEEKHDILMLSFRGESDKSLRILDAIRGLGWSTDGRHLYVATLRRVLQFELADNDVRIPSLFQLCARKVREWKERVHSQKYTQESEAKINMAFKPIPEEWEYVPYFVKRRIWGDLFLMRSHDE
ncbi:hypothetical protein BC939DRAFT_465863 [Gamsiella multidivaricata]|uniref:uncharacterized protein n=1 Tax=Gamsiella multidivaricata TaxID=101098 RepID=UPI0022201309|nr:uncharacterized protein BC939DRAFT_465863 [Gamsiella multidivaricata]KAI7817429.1 hypothetical protein BC939DRAFT_465863 [Gamsiella multidivaricata]